MGGEPNMSNKRGSKYEEEMELRRGPWTLEEDTLLIHYIACHGEGRWNLLARCSGLKRTGKSCRLRWLNYLKPDVKRGNLSPEEQILILELHSKWGNRWSRIAQHLPGRTDNEIKNYWRTRVQKQARQLKIDANSSTFRDAIRWYWMPRLLEKIGSSSSIQPLDPNNTTTTTMVSQALHAPPPELFNSNMEFFDNSGCYDLSMSENCSSSISSDSIALAQLSKLAEFSSSPATDELGSNLYNPFLNGHHINNGYGLDALDLASASSSGVGYSDSDCCPMVANNCVDNIPDNMWSMDELWQVRKLHEWGI